MFIFPNGSEYKLLLVDTNILSEVTKNRSNELNKFIQLIKAYNFAPCFSFQSVLEIKNSSKGGNVDLYSNFLMLFSQIPCIMLYPYREITNQEIQKALYGDSIDIAKTMNAFSICGKDESYDFEKWVSKILNDLSPIIILEENEIVEAANEFQFQRIKAQKNHTRVLFPSFLKEFFNAFFYREAPSLINNRHNVEDYPAIAMMGITKYDRIYNIKNRSVGVNDVNDIFISAYIPYMDAVIMENHQIDLLRQKKSQYGFLSSLELYKMADIR